MKLLTFEDTAATVQPGSNVTHKCNLSQGLWARKSKESISSDLEVRFDRVRPVSLG